MEARLRAEKVAAHAAESERSRLVASFEEKLLSERAEAAARQDAATAAVDQRHRAEVAELRRTHDAALSAAAAEAAAAEAASQAVTEAALASAQVPCHGNAGLLRICKGRQSTQAPELFPRHKAQAGRRPARPPSAGEAACQHARACCMAGRQ